MRPKHHKFVFKGIAPCEGRKRFHNSHPGDLLIEVLHPTWPSMSLVPADLTLAWEANCADDHHPEQHSLNVQQMKLFYASAVGEKEKHILHRKLRNYELKCSAGMGIECWIKILRVSSICSGLCPTHRQSRLDHLINYGLVTIPKSRSLIPKTDQNCSCANTLKRIPTRGPSTAE